MPLKSAKVCRQPGCNNSTRSLYCDRCLELRENADQSTERERNVNRYAAGLRQLYNSRAWRDRARETILSRDPFCKIGTLCGGQAFSTEVDHRIPADVYIAQHGGDSRAFYDE